MWFISRVSFSIFRPIEGVVQVSHFRPPRSKLPKELVECLLLLLPLPLVPSLTPLSPAFLLLLVLVEDCLGSHVS